MKTLTVKMTRSRIACTIRPCDELLTGLSYQYQKDGEFSRTTPFNSSFSHYYANTDIISYGSAILDNEEYYCVRVFEQILSKSCYVEYYFLMSEVKARYDKMENDKSKGGS